MALSKSFQKGQVPMSCQMCEESSDIKWKCIQCDFLLCTKCQKLHKKVKSTDQHTIIDIKDIASYQQQTKDKLDFSNIPCGVHAGQNCCLYCQSCEEVVCPLCITKIHNKHNMIELAEGYEHTLKSMIFFNSDIEEEVNQNKKVLSELGILKSSQDTKYELEMQKIVRRTKVLKDEVDKHSKQLLKDLDQRWEIIVKSVKDAENRSEKINKDLDIRKKNLSQAIHSNNANQVFSRYSEEKTSRQQKIVPVNTILKKMPMFVAGKKVIQDFYLGAFIKTEDDKHQFEFKVIKQYKTDLQVVESLVCCGDASIWMSQFKRHKLKKIKLTNKSLHDIDTFGIDVYNMALLPSGDLLLSTKESSLKVVPYKTSKVEATKYSVNPLITLAVHVTHDHRILVSTREDQPKPFTIKGPRQVIMINIDQNKGKVYHTDNKGKSIFTLPHRITSDNDNNIYVIDILDEEYNGRIVALEKTNGARWIYNGHPEINKEKTFRPKDLVATKSDQIIVTDDGIHMIYILNTAGQCIHYLNTNDQLGIKLPTSVDTDNRGILHIGCNTYNSEPEEAKIYTVQVSGF